MKAIKLCLSALCLLMVIAVSSCSKQSKEVEGAVPAGSGVIVAVDGERILDNAGGKYSSDGIVLPEALKSVAGEEAVEQLDKFKGLDIKHMYFFAEVTGNGALVAPVTDEAALLDFVKELGLEVKEMDGYKVASMGRNTLMVRDNLFWYAAMSAQNAVDFVEDSRKKAADDGSLAECGWRSDFFGSDHAVSVLVNFGKMPFIASQLGATYSDDMPGAQVMKAMLSGSLAVVSNLDGLKLTISYSCFDKDGKKLDISPEASGLKLQKVSADFLQYLNSNDVLAVAGGVPADYPWEKMLDAMAKQAGAYGDQMKLALPYLQSIEGTIAFAAGPANGVASFSKGSVTDNWDGLFYVGLKEGKAKEYMAQLQGLLQQMMPEGVKVVDADNITVSVEDMTFYIGVRGNNLIAATREITGGHTDGLFKASEFTSEYGVALLRLNKDSRLCTELNMPFGVFSKMAQDGNNSATWLIEETDTTGKFIENIINYVVSLGL